MINIEIEVKKWLKKRGIVGMFNIWLECATFFFELGKKQNEKDKRST